MESKQGAARSTERDNAEEEGRRGDGGRAAAAPAEPQPSGARDQPQAEPPIDFICPISLELMQDPVVATTGMTYDRSSIEEWWFKFNNHTCPTTGQKVDSTFLVPNVHMRKQIHQWLQDNPDSLNSPGQQDKAAAAAAAALQRHAERLHSSDPGTQLQALDMLLDSCSGEAEGGQAYCLVTSGAYLQLVDMLRSGPREHRWKAISLLNCLAQGRRAQAVLLQAGLLEAVVDLLADAEPDHGLQQQEQVHGSSLLLTLAAHKGNRWRLLRCGAVGMLFNLLQGTNTESYVNCLTALTILSEHRDMSEQLNKTSSVRALLPILEQEGVDDACKTHLLALLINLAALDSTKVKLVNLDAVEALLRVLEHSASTQLQEKASCLITLVASSEDAALRMVAGHGCIAPFTRLLVSKSDVCRRTATGVLFLLVMSNGRDHSNKWWGPKRQTAAQVIIDQGGVASLVSLVHGEDEEAQEKGLLLLRLLACAEQLTNKDKFCDCGAVKQLVQVLRSGAGSRVEHAVLALGGLCADPRARAAVAQAGAARQLRRLATAQPEVKEAAQEALHLLVDGELELLYRSSYKSGVTRVYMPVRHLM